MFQVQEQGFAKEAPVDPVKQLARDVTARVLAGVIALKMTAMIFGGKLAPEAIEEALNVVRNDVEEDIRSYLVSH